VFADWHDIKRRPKGEHKGKVLTAQIDWELKELVRIYEELAPRHVLEIGSQFGGTLWYWLNAVPDESVVVNIDILQNMTDEDKARLPGMWKDWARDGVKQYTLIGRSDDMEIMNSALEYLEDSIDFLFIDAVHTYEGAKSDFELYGPWVSPGGVIALHDLMTPDFSPHIQVGKLWREIQEAGYVTKELRAGGIYGGIGVVYV
jgi:predicted O-methyltransferase YrrM